MNKFQEEKEAFQREFGDAEYTLKRSGHLRKGRRVAEADWAVFATSLGKEFYDEVVSSGIAKTLIGEPPGIFLRDLRWTERRETPLANVTELIVEGVCRVRNNSDHGEKFRGTNGQWKRDFQLISEARLVLALAMRRSAKP